MKKRNMTKYTILTVEYNPRRKWAPYKLQLEVDVDNLTHQEKLMMIIRLLDAGFTITDIRKFLGVNGKTMYKYIRELEHMGLIRKSAHGKYEILQGVRL